jgi:hypothetical protein
VLEARGCRLHDILYDLPGGVFGVGNWTDDHYHRQWASSLSAVVAQLSQHPPGPGPRVILLGRRFLSTETTNRRSRQYRASSGPPQKTEKVNF